MAALSVRLSDEESEIESEDEYDLELFDKAYAKYLKDKKTYTTEEVLKKLNIEI